MSEKDSNVVVMKDGRSVDFGVRGKKKTEIAVTETGVKLTFDVINGDTHVAEFDVPSVESNPLLKELFAYGVSQKITDSVVKEKDEDDISLGIKKMIDQLQAGVWTTRVASEGIARGLSDLIEAIRRIKGYELGSASFETLKASILAKDEAELAIFKTNPSIKTIIAEIQAEKAAAKLAKLKSSSADADSLDDLLEDF